MDVNAERDTLIRLYVTEGLTLVKVAERLGVSPELVRLRMDEHGIPRRQAGPVKRLLIEAEEKTA